MQIHGPAHVHGPQPINPPHHAAPPSTAADSTSPTSIHAADQLDISEAAQLISQARDAAPIRLDRVADIRAQIADGTYDTTDKLDLAVDRLLNELG